MSNIYSSVTGCTNINSVTVSSSHGNLVALASVDCKDTTLEIGDSISIDMGYSDNHGVVFTGYVKQIAHQVQADTYVISAYDVLVRSQDFFIASSTPDNPLKYQNITAETLVGNLLALAGLTNYDYDATSFTFGVQKEFEINLVAVADYCRMISDLLTWHMWADKTGTVYFKNRKPFFVADTYDQFGLTLDPVPTDIITDEITLSATYSKDDKNLRNKIVVYGTGNAHGEASIVSPYLPEGFYRTSLLAAEGLLDTNEICNTVAQYNLDQLHRLTERIQATIVGDHTLSSHSVIEVNLSTLEQTGEQNYWYVYTVEHSISSVGFITNLELTK